VDSRPSRGHCLLPADRLARLGQGSTQPPLSRGRRHRGNASDRGTCYHRVLVSPLRKLSFWGPANGEEDPFLRNSETRTVRQLSRYLMPLEMSPRVTCAIQHQAPVPVSGGRGSAPPEGGYRDRLHLTLTCPRLLEATGRQEHGTVGEQGTSNIWRHGPRMHGAFPSVSTFWGQRWTSPVPQGTGQAL
jgi:hypothetical protein